MHNQYVIRTKCLIRFCDNKIKSFKIPSDDDVCYTALLKSILPEIIAFYPSIHEDFIDQSIDALDCQTTTEYQLLERIIDVFSFNDHLSYLLKSISVHLLKKHLEFLKLSTLTSYNTDLLLKIIRPFCTCPNHKLTVQMSFTIAAICSHIFATTNSNDLKRTRSTFDLLILTSSEPNSLVYSFFVHLLLDYVFWNGVFDQYQPREQSAFEMNNRITSETLLRKHSTILSLDLNRRMFFKFILTRLCNCSLGPDDDEDHSYPRFTYLSNAMLLRFFKSPADHEFSFESTSLFILPKIRCSQDPNMLEVTSDRNMNGLVESELEPDLALKSARKKAVKFLTRLNEIPIVLDVVSIALVYPQSIDDCFTGFIAQYLLALVFAFEYSPSNQRSSLINHVSMLCNLLKAANLIPEPIENIGLLVQHLNNAELHALLAWIWNLQVIQANPDSPDLITLQQDAETYVCKRLQVPEFVKEYGPECRNVLMAILSTLWRFGVKYRRQIDKESYSKLFGWICV
ncbi:hypothetical protein ACOME3_000674 [Neoechinorhynchus agilis]